MSFGRLDPGDVIDGKYEVERILGSGGMGVVVAARHLDIGQRVAIKFMLRESLANPGNAERFLREAKSAVKLKSVHTARILDVTRLADGEPFMVMEYLEGRDLDAELNAHGPLPPRMAVDWILQASEALAEAHGLGMIHRDVKLKNLFLTHTVDGEPLVKVLDFGLAKLVGGHDDVSLTSATAIFGSPQYMSPEQMRSAKDADFRSDIWSVGVCLYELIAGRVPFDAPTIAETCAMVLKDEVTPLSSLVPGLPADLEAVVMRCLEKDPSRRFQSIAELACALQSYANDATSVRRIIRVTRSARLVNAVTVQAVETVQTMHAAQPVLPAADSSRRTLSAWDSGTPTGTPVPARTVVTQVQKIAGGVALGLVFAGVVTAFLFLVYARAHHATPLAALPVPTFVPMNLPVEAPLSDRIAPAATAPSTPVLADPAAGAVSSAPPAAPAVAPEAATPHTTKRRVRVPPRVAPTSYGSAAPPGRSGREERARRSGPDPGTEYM